MSRGIVFVIVLLVLVCETGYLFAQDNLKQKFCDKRWYIEKYQEPSGEVYSVDKSKTNEYLIYHCNGDFESLESGMLIKGNWVFNDANKTITVSQKQNKDYPSKVVTTVKTVAGDTLVIEGEDAEGNKLVVYLRTK